MRRLMFLLCLTIFLFGCGAARHVAVQVDATFAQSVFALDDAARMACESKVLTQAQCDAANPKIVQALADVKAVSAGLLASPKAVSVPKNLPDLLQNLTDAQRILGSFQGSSVPADVANKLVQAINQAILLVSKYTEAN